MTSSPNKCLLSLAFSCYSPCGSGRFVLPAFVGFSFPQPLGVGIPQGEDGRPPLSVLAEWSHPHPQCLMHLDTDDSQTSPSILDLSSNLGTHLPSCVSDISLWCLKGTQTQHVQNCFIIFPWQTSPHPGCLSQGRASPSSQVYKSETWKAILNTRLLFIPHIHHQVLLLLPFVPLHLLPLYLLHLPTSFCCCHPRGHHSGPSSYHFWLRFFQVPSHWCSLHWFQSPHQTLTTLWAELPCWNENLTTVYPPSFPHSMILSRISYYSWNK